MYYGVDIGGTTAKIGAFKNDKLIDSWQVETQVESLEKLVNNIVDSIKEKDKNILGLGIDVPGFIKDNVISSSANLHFLDGVNLEEAFKKAINVPIKVINDANCHALGEAKYAKLDNIIFVALGTGVGGGFVLNGQVLEGANGAGMEIGHIHVDDKYNFRCGCGQVGCLETLCGQKGVHNLVDYYRNSLATKLEVDYTVKDVFDLARGNDPLAYQVFEVFTDKLGLALANVSALFNPGTIIIGGGISQAGDFLINHIKTNFLKYATPVVRDTKIILASLGSNAGMYGAYYLIRDLVKEQQ